MRRAPQPSHARNVTNAIIPTAAATDLLDYIIYISLIPTQLPSVAIFGVVRCDFNCGPRGRLSVGLGRRRNAFRLDFGADGFYCFFELFGSGRRPGRPLLSRPLSLGRLRGRSQSRSGRLQLVDIVVHLLGGRISPNRRLRRSGVGGRGSDWEADCRLQRRRRCGGRRLPKRTSPPWPSLALNLVGVSDVEDREFVQETAVEPPKRMEVVLREDRVSVSGKQCQQSVGAWNALLLHEPTAAGFMRTSNRVAGAASGL